MDHFITYNFLHYFSITCLSSLLKNVFQRFIYPSLCSIIVNSTFSLNVPLQIYSMTIRLSAMFEDRVDSVLRDWYESASGGARRTRLRTMRLLGSQAPDTRGVSRHRASHSGSQAASSAAAHSSGAGSSSDSLGTRENRTRSVATRAATTSDSDLRNGYGHAVTSRTETRGSSRANPQSRHDRDNDNVFDDTGSGRQTRSSARRELVMRFPASRIQENRQEESVSNGPLTSRYSTRRSTSLAQESASVNGEESDEDEEDEEEEEEGEEGSEEGEEEQGEDSEEGDEEEQEEEDEEEDDEDEEEEESDDSTVESRHQTRRKTARPTHRPTVTVRTNRSANTSNARSNRRQSNGSSSRRTSETSQRNANPPARRSLRRNSSARRVRYNENDSDSESDSLGNEVIGVSSRGRVRKPAVRMQDYVE